MKKLDAGNAAVLIDRINRHGTHDRIRLNPKTRAALVLDERYALAESATVTDDSIAGLPLLDDESVPLGVLRVEVDVEPRSLAAMQEVHGKPDAKAIAESRQAAQDDAG